MPVNWCVILQPLIYYLFTYRRCINNSGCVSSLSYTRMIINGKGISSGRFKLLCNRTHGETSDKENRERPRFESGRSEMKVRCVKERLMSIDFTG